MHRIGTGSVLVACIGLAGCASAPKPITDADRAMARQMDSAFAAANNAGDVHGMMASYAPDAMVMPPNMPMAHGSDQIRQLWTGMTAQKGTLQLTQQTAGGAGDFMYVTGKYHYAMPAPSTATEDGKYLEVFRRGADGNWMLVADSWSSDAPPPAPAPAQPAPKARRH